MRCRHVLLCQTNTAGFNYTLKFQTHFHFLDSETTEDEGEEQFETKEDLEEQIVHTGIHHVCTLVVFGNPQT